MILAQQVNDKVVYFDPAAVVAASRLIRPGTYADHCKAWGLIPLEELRGLSTLGLLQALFDDAVPCSQPLYKVSVLRKTDTGELIRP